MSASPRWLAVAVLVALVGCGGSDTTTGPSAAWKAGTFEPSSSFANKCASPRTGTDPTTGKPYADTAGSTTLENNFLRSWTNELYLWYREVPDFDPASYSSTSSYFNILKTSATTASGNPKDRFHFTYTTAQWIALAQSGIEAGYGANWVVIASTPPRRVVVAYVDPGTPAADAGLARGTQVLTVDGVDLVNASDSASVNALNTGLFPSAAGTSHTFTVQDVGGSPRTITMVSANVTSTPVQNVRTVRGPSGTVGYVLFNDHIATAEPLLIAAFSQLASAGVSDLVLDLRYNGGGYLDIASEVAYMVAGPAPTTGRTFERTVFNDKNPTRNPVTGQALTPVPFHSTSQGFSGAAGQALPTLNLPRVAVLTGSNTCSASESIINSLRGVGVEVVEVGARTCGKPYGFYPEDNCGTTYFSIQFQGVNDQGFGDYPDGFSPANSSGGVSIPGCAVADDFDHALGDSSEARFSAALGYLGGRGCPAVSAGAPGAGVSQAIAAAVAAREGEMLRPPTRQNRLMRR